MPGSGLKLYDIEGQNPKLSETTARILVEATARRRMGGHNELMYAEADYERRLQRRRYRLLACTEEVFAHVQAYNANNSNPRVSPMDPKTAAQAVFGGISRPLNRYLRFTRQQKYHDKDTIVEHLERCLAYRFSARTFLQRFFSKRAPYTKVWL